MSQGKNTLEIKKFGAEVLRTPAKTVTKFDKKLFKLADKMLKTMYAENGVGLAAPQVGESVRMLVIDTEYASERYDDAGKSTDDTRNPFIIINPVIVFQEGEMESFEGCLSFPEVFFNVKRARRIVVKFQDINGKEHRMEAEGDLFCRCLQHEIDHLNGKLFVDIALDSGIAKEELQKHGFGDVNSPAPMII